MFYKLSNLEKRVEYLEKFIKEKNASRSHAPSKAYLIWKFLVDHGGSTRESIKDSFPKDEQDGISTVLADCVNNNIIKLNGEHYFANRVYKWDDIGVCDNQDSKNIVDDLKYLMNRV